MANITLPNYGSSSSFKFIDGTIGEIITALFPYIYAIAGFAMLVMIIAGGISLMTAVGDPAKTKAGYGKISAGVIGFLIIFISYFVVQLVEVILGINIF